MAEVLTIQPVYQAHTRFHGATVKSGQDGTRPPRKQSALRLRAAIRCFGSIAGQFGHIRMLGTTSSRRLNAIIPQSPKFSNEITSSVFSSAHP